MALSDLISAAQCRAARGLLGWTQQDLASAAGLSKTAIVQFETEIARTREETLTQISMALIRQGIEFVAPDGVNRSVMACQLFTDTERLKQHWPLFLQAFVDLERIDLINWPEFLDEFTALTGHRPQVQHVASPFHKAAQLGEWVIMPVLDSAFRIALQQKPATETL